MYTYVHPPFPLIDHWSIICALECMTPNAPLYFLFGVSNAYTSDLLSLTEHHCSENENHGLDSCSSLNPYFISTLQWWYNIWLSDHQSYKCPCFSALFFLDVVCIILNLPLYFLVRLLTHLSHPLQPWLHIHVDPQKSREHTKISPIWSCLPHLWKFQAHARFSLRFSWGLGPLVVYFVE